MSTEPTGLLGLPLAMARDMLCASAAFRAWVGAEDAEAAKAAVDFCLVFDDDGPAALSSNPGAMIDFGQQHAGQCRTYGRGATYTMQNSIFLYIEKTFDPAVSKQEALIQFANEVGPVLSELFAQSGGNGCLNIQTFELLSGPVLEFGSRRQSEGQSVNLSYLIMHGTG